MEGGFGPWTRKRSHSNPDSPISKWVTSAEDYVIARSRAASERRIQERVAAEQEWAAFGRLKSQALEISNANGDHRSWMAMKERVGEFGSHTRDAQLKIEAERLVDQMERTMARQGLARAARAIVPVPVVSDAGNHIRAADPPINWDDPVPADHAKFLNEVLSDWIATPNGSDDRCELISDVRAALRDAKSRDDSVILQAIADLRGYLADEAGPFGGLLADSAPETVYLKHDLDEYAQASMTGYRDVQEQAAAQFHRKWIRGVFRDVLRALEHGPPPACTSNNDAPDFEEDGDMHGDKHGYNEEANGPGNDTYRISAIHGGAAGNSSGAHISTLMCVALTAAVACLGA